MTYVARFRVPRWVRDNPDLPDHILDAFRVMPNDAISIFTIRWVLERDGREVSKAVIYDVCEWLVDVGFLECVNAMGDFIRRYRMIERRPDGSLAEHL